MQQINAQAIGQKMQIPPQLQSAYQRVVMAGQKYMYDPSKQQQIMQYMNGQGAIDDKLAQGVGSIMIALYMQSNKTMPLQVLIPAAITLMADAVDFLNKAKPGFVQPNAVGSATEKMIFFILHKFGISQQQAMQMMQNFHNNVKKKGVLSAAQQGAAQPVPAQGGM